MDQGVFPSVSGTEEIKKTRSVGEPLEFVCKWGDLWKKLIHPSYYLIYQPSLKSWQNISLYKELSWFVLDWELIFVVLIPYLITKEGPVQASH